MAADTVKSLSVTALDTVPVLKPDTGQGAAGELQSVNDVVAATTGGLASTSSTYQAVRVPSTCKLKSLIVTNDTLMDTGGLAAALVLYVGAQYSDAPGNNIVDGTSYSNSGVVIQKEAFGSITNPAANTRTEMIPNAGAQSWGTGSGNNQLLSKNLPLWQALGLASDPGGFIDITIYVHTAANTAAAGNMDVEAKFVM